MASWTLFLLHTVYYVLSGQGGGYTLRSGEGQLWRADSSGAATSQSLRQLKEGQTLSQPRLRSLTKTYKGSVYFVWSRPKGGPWGNSPLINSLAGSNQRMRRSSEAHAMEQVSAEPVWIIPKDSILNCCWRIIANPWNGQLRTMQLLRVTPRQKCFGGKKKPGFRRSSQQLLQVRVQDHKTISSEFTH